MRNIGNARNKVTSGNSDSKMFAIGERVPGIAYLLKCKNISYHDVSHVGKNLERLLQSEYFRCLQNIREMENARSHTKCDNLHILGKYSRTFKAGSIERNFWTTYRPFLSNLS